MIHDEQEGSRQIHAYYDAWSKYQSQAQRIAEVKRGIVPPVSYSGKRLRPTTVYYHGAGTLTIPADVAPHVIGKNGAQIKALSQVLGLRYLKVITSSATGANELRVSVFHPPARPTFSTDRPMNQGCESNLRVNQPQ